MQIIHGRQNVESQRKIMVFNNTKAFVYKWTQLSTQMWYIGSHYARGCHPDDGYYCSSKIVKPLILSNITDWKREILVIGSSNYVIQIEADYLKLLDAKNDPKSYNRHNGDGKFSAKLTPTKEHKLKLSISHKGKIPWNKGKKTGTQKYKRINTWNKGKKLGYYRGPQTAESNLKRSLSMTGLKRGPQSPEHIAKCTALKLGKKLGPQSPEHKENNAAARRGKTSKNKGKKLNPLSSKHKENISNSKKGKKQIKIICPHCLKEGGISNIKRWHNDNCKNKPMFQLEGS